MGIDTLGFLKRLSPEQKAVWMAVQFREPPTPPPGMFKAEKQAWDAAIETIRRAAAGYFISRAQYEADVATGRLQPKAIKAERQYVAAWRRQAIEQCGHIGLTAEESTKAGEDAALRQWFQVPSGEAPGEEGRA